MKIEPLQLTGRATQALGQYRFRVEFDHGHTATCVVAGKLITRHVYVEPGDICQCELSPFDLSRGRIVWREARKQTREH